MAGEFVNRDLVWRFEMIDESYEKPNTPDYNVSVGDMTLARLQHTVCQIGDILHFQYDFGDGWQVSLEVKNIVETEEARRDELPRVLDGAGYGIVEDCGGVSYLGRQHVPEFDIDDMNFRLKKIPHIY